MYPCRTGHLIMLGAAARARIKRTRPRPTVVLLRLPLTQPQCHVARRGARRGQSRRPSFQPRGNRSCRPEWWLPEREAMYTASTSGILPFGDGDAHAVHEVRRYRRRFLREATPSLTMTASLKAYSVGCLRLRHRASNATRCGRPARATSHERGIHVDRKSQIKARHGTGPRAVSDRNSAIGRYRGW